MSAQGGFEVRSGTCSSALESMCLCFINSWSQRLRMGKEVALALAACHSSGVLHRDVTSFNVMLSDMNDGSESAAEHALRWCEVVRICSYLVPCTCVPESVGAWHISP